ncbi:MAG: LamG domain-containing protein, partial [Bacteroidetes bacterium]|nr:LamG domain-containing protein [Bacteroidota bacterium]
MENKIITKFACRIFIVLMVLACSSRVSYSQCSIVNQTVNTVQSSVCIGSSGQVQLGSSQAGVTYKLRNDADNAVIGSALTGTGSSLSFSTGALISNTSFNVYAEYASYGVQFDGSNDHITLTNPVNTASFTLEAWIKTSVESWTGTNAFEGSGLLYADVGGGANDYTFALINNKITFFDGGNNINVTGTTNLNDGNWHHVAMIRTAGVKNRLYVDGVFQAEANASSVVLNARAQMVIGGNNGDNRYFNGTMDEVRVWNFAMDPAVLAANMYTCYTGTETGLRALFKFENGPNSATATNSIGSNNGTLVNTNNAAVWVSGTNICSGCNLEMTDIVSVSISPLPAAPTGSESQSLCSGTTLASLSATGSNIKWYAASSGGSVLASTTALVNNTTYYASQTVNGCEGTSRLAVLVTLVTHPSAPGQSATGGTVTTVGGYKIHTFTTSGTFTVPAGMTGVNAEVLVVAGGGGGGFRHAGGGGAGGLVYNSSFALTAGQSYTVTVGSGGAGAPNSGTNQGSSGGNSVFGNITAIGGGGGGTNTKVGNSGGSGGGGSNGTNGGNGTAGQGNKGGNQNNGAGCCHAWGCGGGGAGAAGANTSNSAGSVGGVGLQYSISGTPTYYAGGGGGGNGANATVLVGGSGGGGNGGTNAGAPTAGTPNTGGGGGGGGVAPEPGAAGGSGIVIVRYLDSGASSLNQTFCGASTVSNLSMSGTNVQWYNVPTGGTALSTSTSISTGTYYASQSNGSCESARTTVTVTVNTPITYYLDADNDGYYVSSTTACASPGASYRTSGNILGDCNDNNASVFGITETCNGLDDDCDGTADDGLTFVNYYTDNDGDGYGSGVASNLCADPGAGYVTNNTDCNDNNAALNSITTEVCNNFDDDCDGSVDDGLTFINYYSDNDGDGYGAGAASNLCADPGAGYVTNNTDCNDNNATLNSISTEVCNNFDDDCDGSG